MANDKPLSLDGLKGIELEPGKDYMLVFNMQAIRRSDAQMIANELARKNIESLMVGVQGDPSEAITVLKATREARRDSRRN